MGSKRGGMSKVKEARIEKAKQPAYKYEKDLFLNNECGEKFRSNYSRRKFVGG